MVVVTMLVAFMMMMVSRLALTAARHMRKLIIYENNIRYSGLRKDNHKVLTNHKAQGLFLADTLTSDQDLVNSGEFVDPLTTWALPVNNGTVLGGQESLRKNVVGNVRKPLKAPFHAGELDALCHDLCVRVVDVDVAEPQVRWDILCFQASVRMRVRIFILETFTNDEFQGGIRAFADTFDEKFINGGAGLDPDSVFLLPPGGGAVLGLNEAFAEH
jgi:hypothetical protein